MGMNFFDRIYIFFRNNYLYVIKANIVVSNHYNAFYKKFKLLTKITHGGSEFRRNSK